MKSAGAEPRVARRGFTFAGSGRGRTSGAGKRGGRRKPAPAGCISPSCSRVAVSR